MIKFRIKELMEERGIKKPKIKPLVKLGISYKIVQKYLDGSRQVMDRSHMEIFCLFLRCEPNDLFVWTDDKKIPIDELHPLHKIKPRTPFSLLEATKNMTPDEIRKMLEDNEKKKKEEKEK